MRKTLIAVIVITLMIPAASFAYVGFDDEGSPLYGWSDTRNSEDEHVPDYDFRSISSTGTLISSSTDPGWDYSSYCAGPIDIGFEFEFYDEIYETVQMCCDGVLLFGRGSMTDSTTVQTLPNTTNPNNLVTSQWNREFYYYNSSGYFQTRGSPPERQFVAQFYGANYSYNIEHQVVLDEATMNIYAYVPRSGSFSTASSIGIENEDGTRGISALYASPSSTPLSEYAAIFAYFGEKPMISVLTTDLTVMESEELTLEVSVRDRQGGDITVDWDFNGDGDYTDDEGTSIVINPREFEEEFLELTVRATDDSGNERTRVVEVIVNNEPPVFSNDPDLTAIQDQEWTYDPGIVDPGEDDVTVTAVEKPAGMTLLADGSLRWTPNEDNVGTHQIILVARDDDDDPDVDGDGDATKEFELVVRQNTPPQRPTIFSPENEEVLDYTLVTFQVETPMDAEDDEVFLFFDLDTVDTFSSDNLISSGEVETTRGISSWTPDDYLEDMTKYYLRVRASDGYEMGPAATITFEINTGRISGDADVDGGADAGPTGDFEAGCSATARSAGTSSTALLVIVLGLVAIVSLRRR